TKAGLILFRFNQATYGEALRVNSETLYPADGQTWIHVAATFDGSIARLYVNGVENRTKTLDGAPPININNLPLAIGAQHDGNRTFSGAMDDVRVYNRALSAEEILELASTQSTGSLSASSNEGMNSTNENNIVAYPNPFAGDLKVNFTLAEKGAYKVSLYNSKGDLIEEIKKGESEAHVTNSVEFDGSTLPKGLYLMKLETSKGIKTYKLLK
ncbi:MAG: T9SS type A sorting domain-containing protein, partial [Pontibacter sp.]|nr:T9SS type A sorting domain-containing protein [Pontibacter sp.]